MPLFFPNGATTRSMGYKERVYKERLVQFLDSMSIGHGLIHIILFSHVKTGHGQLNTSILNT